MPGLEDPDSSHPFLFQLWTSIAARLSPRYTEASQPNPTEDLTGCWAVMTLVAKRTIL